MEVFEGKAQARLTVQKYHLNSLGTLHGGTIFALADVVLGAASNSHGRIAVAIHATISYIKAFSEGVLTAETEELSRDAVLGCTTFVLPVIQETLLPCFKGEYISNKTKQRFIRYNSCLVKMNEILQLDPFCCPANNSETIPHLNDVLCDITC